MKVYWNSAMRKLYRLVFLPFQKKKLLCQSFFLVWIIRICLWFMPYKKLSDGLFRFNSKDSSPDGKWEVIKEVSNAVRSVSRFVPSATCLTQALAVRTLLRLRGQKSKLQIGVARDENQKFLAHAWIEVEGRVVIGETADLKQYSVLTITRER
jgi:hypothetical protein